MTLCDYANRPRAKFMHDNNSVMIKALDCDQEIAGSTPGRSTFIYDPRQVVHTHVPLSPSSIIWYWREWCWAGKVTMAWTVIAAYHRVVYIRFSSHLQTDKMVCIQRLY